MTMIWYPFWNGESITRHFLLIMLKSSSLKTVFIEGILGGKDNRNMFFSSPSPPLFRTSPAPADFPATSASALSTLAPIRALPVSCGGSAMEQQPLLEVCPRLPPFSFCRVLWRHRLVGRGVSCCSSALASNWVHDCAHHRVWFAAVGSVPSFWSPLPTRDGISSLG